MLVHLTRHALLVAYLCIPPVHREWKQKFSFILFAPFLAGGEGLGMGLFQLMQNLCHPKDRVKRGNSEDLFLFIAPKSLLGQRSQDCKN